jgi:hypothetical protein
MQKNLRRIGFQENIFLLIYLPETFRRENAVHKVAIFPTAHKPEVKTLGVFTSGL